VLGVKRGDGLKYRGELSRRVRSGDSALLSVVEDSDGGVEDDSRSKYGIDMDLRRERGKNPSVLRGTRPISTGAGKSSIRTHASCFHICSPSTFVPLSSCVCDSTGAIELPFRSSVEDFADGPSPKRSRLSGLGILRPLTEQASAGKSTVFLV
jgi:hypothetical protein